MVDILPKGWVKTTLGEVCARVATIQPAESPDTEFTYFDIVRHANRNLAIHSIETDFGIKYADKSSRLTI
jgi:hypothetical protein